MKSTERQRTIVMTGATNGFGAHTVKYLSQEPNTRVIVGARGKNRHVPQGVTVLPLDLSSLESVRKFADSVIENLGDSRIDILILNAGTHTPDISKRSPDGFEWTFAVNHLSHYLLSRLLLPYIATNGRLEVTTSDTHDPAVTGMAPKDTSIDPQEYAHPTKKSSTLLAYSTSKLCNLMTAEYLARLDAVKQRGISVIAFSPGLTSGSAGLDTPRLSHAIIALLMRTVFPVVGMFKPEFAPNKPEHSGKLLMEFALGRRELPQGKVYVTLVKGEPVFPDTSELAQNKVEQEKLWRVSEVMVGLNKSKR